MCLMLILALSADDDEAKHASERKAARMLLGAVTLVSFFFVFQDPSRNSELKLCIIRLKRMEGQRYQ